jgi:mitochondrial fission protein ELM1
LTRCHIFYFGKIVSEIFQHHVRNQSEVPKKRRPATRVLNRKTHAGRGILASTSQRTLPAAAHSLRSAFAGVPGVVWCGERDGPNPYAGLLGWAERIVCTPDSVNLLSEACATRVPVTVAMPLTAHGRARDFHAALHARGRLADATDVHGAATHTIAPLRETARIATRIRERLALDASD